MMINIKYKLISPIIVTFFVLLIGCNSEEGSKNSKNKEVKKEEVRKNTRDEEEPEKRDKKLETDEEVQKSQKYTLSGDIHAPNSFKSMPDLLQKSLSYAPIADLLSKIEKNRSIKLKTRGEAHITIITPLEFKKLKSHLSLAQIEKAFKDDVEKSEFSIKCLGRGEKILNGKKEQVFYLVIESPDISKIREKIHDLFVKKGGKSSDFDPHLFYPHITVGFSERDLHLDDGVTKDINSCIATLTV